MSAGHARPAARTMIAAPPERRYAVRSRCQRGLSMRRALLRSGPYVRPVTSTQFGQPSAKLRVSASTSMSPIAESLSTQRTRPALRASAAAPRNGATAVLPDTSVATVSAAAATVTVQPGDG